MKIIGINQEKCTGCGMCAVECPANLFSVEKGKTALYADSNRWCIGCGHCIAVCSADAVQCEAEQSVRKQPEIIPDINSTMNLLYSKRSVRNYKKEIVSEKEVESVLEAMRYAPTGHNAQSCNFTVITDKTIITALKESTIRSLKSFRRVMNFHWLLKPIVPKTLYELMSDKSIKLGIDDMVSRYVAGEDPIFFNAPVVIAGHVPDMGEESFIDPAIAFTYGMLAAQAMRIGSCWMGFTIMAVKKNTKIHQLLNIPKGSKICAVMTLGYASTTYTKVPVRRERNVEWFK